MLWRQLPLCVEAIVFEVLSLLLQGLSLDTWRMTPLLLVTLPGAPVSVQELPGARPTSRLRSATEHLSQECGSKTSTASTRKHNARAGMGKARAGRRRARARARAGKGMALASEDRKGALVALRARTASEDRIAWVLN